MTSAGFPHSGTAGSKDVCSSPTRFAAYCALHRLLAPRHPPYALRSLTKPKIQSKFEVRGSRFENPSPHTSAPRPVLKTTHAHSLPYSYDNEQTNNAPIGTPRTATMTVRTYLTASAARPPMPETPASHQKAFLQNAL
jgi:hypothetical protein